METMFQLDHILVVIAAIITAKNVQNLSAGITALYVITALGVVTIVMKTFVPNVLTYARVAFTLIAVMIAAATIIASNSLFPGLLN